MHHHNKCPLCSSEKISLKFICTDHFISREDFPVFTCDSCGFNFTQDHPGEEEIGRYYESEDYISHSDTTSGLSNKVYHLARNYMLRKKVDIIRKATNLRTGSILDIGSGTGHFARKIKEAGWQVTGIEINEKARQYSKSFGLDILSPENISNLPSGTFDCITLWHVLEHFQYPFDYASEIRRLLKPDGIGIVALPNCSSYDALYYGKFWAAWDIPRHLLHFNPQTFRIFSEMTGFKLSGIKTLPLDVFYISGLSEKYKKTRLSFVSGLIKGLWFSVKTLFNNQGASSLIYIINKKD